MAEIGLTRLLYAMAAREMSHAFVVDFQVKLQAALRRGTVGATRQIEQFVKLLESGFGNPSDVQEQMTPIAQTMHEALLAAYDETVEARKVVPSYRIGQNRFSGGALRRALEDPSMVEATGSGIKYLNSSVLDTEARHWRRLNYGAGAAAGAASTREAVFHDERLLFYIGSEAGPRPAFSLPPGFFVDPRTRTVASYGHDPSGNPLALPPTQHEFYPVNATSGQWRGTRGIEGRHFIDAGFEVLAAQFGPALDELFRKWTAQAEREFRPIPTNVTA